MKIIALGGGEIGRAGFSVETAEIDKEIIRLTEKNNPKLLFIPTASSDSVGYLEDIKKHFGKELDCSVDVLYLINKHANKEIFKKKIFSSDIIYVGGGNTLKMMRLWRKYEIDKMLREAGEKGIVLSGVSAGGICWFKYGSSDSRRFTNPNADLIRVRGLNFISALFCPHFDIEKDGKLHIKKLMENTSGIGIAVDNCCAIEIVNSEYKIIASKKSANAYRVYWKKGKYYEDKIDKIEKMQPLSLLLNK